MKGFSFGPSGGSLESWVRPCSRLVSASFRYRIAGVCGPDGCAPLCGGILQVRAARNVRGKPCATVADGALPAAAFRPRAPCAGMGLSRYMHHAGVYDFFRWRTTGHVPDRHGLAARALAGPFGTEKLLTAFAISLCLNTLFAPVLMVAHKVSDLHIARYEGDAALFVAPSRRRRAVEVRQLGRHVAAGAVPHRGLLLDPRPYHYISAAGSLPGAVRRLARSGTRPDPRVGRFAAGEGLGMAP